ncbi:MAG TPA: nucleotide exchange factor GrpE [Gemmatimonadaceae bacterium]|nr:nucleotide exchange factor GrpE [Gemmatimonadaceae bacterium]
MQSSDDSPLEVNDQPAADGASIDQSDEAPSRVDPVARELAEQRDKYLRLAAEYDNYRKRSMRERAEAEGRGQSSLIKLLLDPLDDLSRFAHVDPASVDPSTITQGADMVERKLLKVLAAVGVEVIDPANAPFDPSVHEAVSTEPAESPDEDDVVSRVFQVGYRHNGQLLRPARVVVKQWNG